MQRGCRCPFHRRRLRYDATFRSEIRYCYEHGIPHAKFLKWKDEDRAKVLAYMMEKAGQCGRCGSSQWEWDPERGGDEHAYQALPMKCPGCAELDLGREILGDSKAPGTSIQLVPQATAERMLHAPRKRPKSKREKRSKER